MQRRSAVLATAVAALLGAATAVASHSLAPLSTLGTLVAAPAPGPLGLENVPVPQVAPLAAPGKIKLGQTISGVTCQASEKVALHIHTHLTIFVNGAARQVPYGIGIGTPLQGANDATGPFVTQGACFAWLHTHTADGIIHVESPVKRAYSLGQFFDVWGLTLSRLQVGPAHGAVTVLVDSHVWTGDLRAIPLSNKTQIQIEVGRPLVAPEKITFPEGLTPSMTAK
ncbi:MAG: hypothetical protein WCH31_06785 [Actinomycetes bacterium]